jgi:outer membrane biosynthesis protein TonB
VARKPKTSVENKPAEDAAAPSANGKLSAPEPKKKAATPRKKKKTAAVRKPSTKKPVTSATKPAPARAAEPTDDQIRIRAYFLGERRHQLSLPGDSAHDWIEARRQLLEEAGR